MSREIHGEVRPECRDRLWDWSSNIFHYRTSKKYDFIWSGGLFDYLTDRQFVLLLKQLRSMCKTEGKIILGNFSIGNPPEVLWKREIGICIIARRMISSGWRWKAG